MTEFNPQEARERCEAGVPAMVSCPSTTEALHLTAEGYAYVGQLRADCYAALERIRELEHALGEVTPKYPAYARVMGERDAALEALEEAQEEITRLKALAACYPAWLPTTGESE